MEVLITTLYILTRQPQAATAETCGLPFRGCVIEFVMPRDSPHVLAYICWSLGVKDRGFEIHWARLASPVWSFAEITTTFNPVCGRTARIGLS